MSLTLTAFENVQVITLLTQEEIKSTDKGQFVIDGHRFLKNIRTRGGTYERAVLVIEAMRNAGVTPTQQKLRKLGYSGRVTSKAKAAGLLM